MRRFAIALLALVPVASLRAQMAEVQPGARVRLTAPSVLGSRLEGTVIARTRDSLTLLRNGTIPVVISLRDVQSISMFDGKSRMAGAKRGAIIGGALMGVLGGVLAITPSDGCDPKTDVGCVQFTWADVPVTALLGVLTSLAF